MTPRLYCPVELDAAMALALPDNAAHHAARVLRLGAGDAVTLFNGQGGEYKAELVEVRGGAVRARVLAHEPVERETPQHITLVQALVGSDRMDYALQKAVELGAAAIQPVTAERSIGRLDAARAEKRKLHWQNIAIAACEQCGRNRIPPVHDLVPFDAWLDAPVTAQHCWMMLPDGELGLRSLTKPHGKIAVMVGPEGGFTTAEASAARAHGWHGLRLGARVLRTESAGAAVLAAVNALWGDFA
jgi:16S rRNA (uracil1498-N3)-methyltransferase